MARYQGNGTTDDTWSLGIITANMNMYRNENICTGNFKISHVQIYRKFEHLKFENFRWSQWRKLNQSENILQIWTRNTVEMSSYWCNFHHWLYMKFKNFWQSQWSISYKNDNISIVAYRTLLLHIGFTRLHFLQCISNEYTSLGLRYWNIFLAIMPECQDLWNKMPFDDAQPWLLR